MTVPSGRCADCKRQTPRLLAMPGDGVVWICADCEYLRGKPDAPKVKRPGPGPGLFDRDEYREGATPERKA